MPGNDEKLVESLFADRGDDLLRYLSARLPNGEDARDLAQETYLRLLRRNRDELVRHPEAYLFRIAANLMYENWLKVRPEGSARSDTVDPDLLNNGELSTEAAVAQQQCVDALGRVLRVMPPMRGDAKQRERKRHLQVARLPSRNDVESSRDRKSGNTPQGKHVIFRAKPQEPAKVRASPPVNPLLRAGVIRMSRHCGQLGAAAKRAVIDGWGDSSLSIKVPLQNS